MPRYAFGPFLLDSETRVLLREGEPVPMAGKTFDTLLILLQNHGRLVDKDELLAQIWPGMVVEEANLSQNIFTVRKILGDSPKDHRYIATVAGRGYQFVAPVTEVNGAAAPAPHRSKARKQIIGFGVVAMGIALAAAAWFVLPRPDKRVRELKQTRLTFNSISNSVDTAAISPDGQYLAYSDPAGIHARLISTGEERLIPNPAEVPSGVRWDIDSWFPDGTRLLVDLEVPGSRSMWAVSVLGRSARKLRENAFGWTVSPDGMHIAFSPSDPSENYRDIFANYREIWVMGSEGEDPRKVLGVGESESLRAVRWSPDGRRLAYTKAQQFRVLVKTCDLKGLNQSTVIEAESSRGINDITWLSDERIIYSQIESPDSNDANLWQIGVDTRSGTPAGKPKRITQWTGSGIFALSVSSNGNRLAFLKVLIQQQTYLGELSDGGTRVSSPRRLIGDETSNSPTAWTADSKAIIFLSDRVNAWGIFKQAINQETADLVTSGSQFAYLPRLSADGAWVLYAQGNGPNSPLHLMRVPVTGGPPQPVLETVPDEDPHCSQPPAKLCVIFEASQDNKRKLLSAFDPLKGRGKLLRTIDNASYAEGLSPDGSMFAVAKREEAEIHIRLLSLVNAPDREITVKGWPSIWGLDWSADGKGFYCGTSSPQRGTLLYVDLKGNARVLWQSSELGRDAYLGGIPSPNGRHLAIWGPAWSSNVWMMEGF